MLKNLYSNMSNYGHAKSLNCITIRLDTITLYYTGITTHTRQNIFHSIYRVKKQKNSVKS